MIDIERVRADTIGCEAVVHLNNAGSSLPPRQVVDAQIGYLRAEELNGGYETQDARAADLDDVYAATSTMLGCDATEVAFVSSAAEAWWRAFTSVPLAPGDRILTGRSEFQANAFGLLQARDRGVMVDVVPNDADGQFDIEAFESMLDERVALVCATQISMSNGAVHPVAEIGRRCRAAAIPFLLDACQAAGQLPLDVDELGCDFLAATGRKFLRGPRGTGLLYVRSGVLDRLRPNGFVDGRSAEWRDDGSWELHDGAMRFEFGEQNYAGKVGLAAAVRYALALGLDEIADRIGALATRLRDDLATIDRVTVRDEGIDRCGIVTFTVDGRTPADVGAALGAAGINVSTPGRRNAQWDIGDRGIDAVVRAGIHYFNTDDELDRLLERLAEG